MTKEEIQQLDEPELIELLENTTESWQKAYKQILILVFFTYYFRHSLNSPEYSA